MTDSDFDLSDETETPEADEASFAAERPIVYIRPLKRSQLPNADTAAPDGDEFVYALHDAQGRALGLYADRAVAAAAARAHDLAPVSAH